MYPDLSALICEYCNGPIPTSPHDRPNRKRRYCSKDHARLALAVQRYRPPEDRFWENVTVTDDPDSCWVWTGPTDDDGYGIMMVGRKSEGTDHSEKAHRFALFLLLGRPIGFGLQSLHTCDNPPCVRNDGERSHLYEGTNRNNVDDKLNRGRHARGSTSSRSVVTRDDYHEIRRLYAAGSGSQRALARQFRTSKSVIGAIVRGERFP
jgi:hypothetical protein